MKCKMFLLDEPWQKYISWYVNSFSLFFLRLAAFSIWLHSWLKRNYKLTCREHLLKSMTISDFNNEFKLNYLIIGKYKQLDTSHQYETVSKSFQTRPCERYYSGKYIHILFKFDHHVFWNSPIENVLSNHSLMRQTSYQHNTYSRFPIKIWKNP